MRRWLAADEQVFASMCADPLVMRYFPAALSAEESIAFIRKIESHFDQKGFGLWALERRCDGRFLGFTGLYTVNLDCPVRGEVEIGWRLAREFWGQGLASEAARAALGFAFESLALPRVISMTAAVNEPSRKLMHRLGMKRAASLDFDHPSIARGHELREHVVYQLRQADSSAAG
jgi:RimJ/RimL family protein N-acetyltransferase